MMTSVYWLIFVNLSFVFCLKKRLLLDGQNVVDQDEIQTLRSELQQLAQTVTDQKNKLALQELEIQKLKSAPGGTYSSGSIYIRWGKANCSRSDAFLVYSGFTAGRDYQSTGSGANFLCLPKDPQWGKYSDTLDYHAAITGAEYEGDAFDGQRVHDYDVPCAVCQSKRANSIMIPGRNTCYHDWYTEYSGYLMSSADTQDRGSEYICVDGHPDVVPNSASNQNGAVIYSVEGRCQPLSCPPYVNGRELTCVVCSN